MTYAMLSTDTNGDNQLDESELEALFQKEVRFVCFFVCLLISFQYHCLQSMNLYSTEAQCF